MRLGINTTEGRVLAHRNNEMTCHIYTYMYTKPAYQFSTEPSSEPVLIIVKLIEDEWRMYPSVN